jgi:hypothetical protein
MCRVRYFFDLRILITLLVSSNASFITVWYKLIIGVKFKVNVKKLGSYFYLKFCEKYIDKRSELKFAIINFPYLDINILITPTLHMNLQFVFRFFTTSLSEY